MKTEREIVDELGRWLCNDMERDLVLTANKDICFSTKQIEKLNVIQDVARRIQWYKENVLEEE